MLGFNTYPAARAPVVISSHTRALRPVVQQRCGGFTDRGLSQCGAVYGESAGEFRPSVPDQSPVRTQVRGGARARRGCD